VDTRLPFGARLSAYIFNTLSQAVLRILKKEKIAGVFCYLDDFLVTARTRQECALALKRLLSLLRQLGFAINYNKLHPPATSLVFLGVLIDTVTFTLSLPADKLHDLLKQLRAVDRLTDMSKRELQSLNGKLNWAAQVIQGGRPHLRRLIDAANHLAQPSDRTHITDDMKADISFWTDFMPHFNGTSLILDTRDTDPVVLDASMTGGGGYFKGQWFYIAWSDWPEAQGKHINCLETITVIPAIYLWAKHWANKRVLLYTDSQAAVSFINKGSARDPLVMSALRILFWFAARFNFKLKAIHYPEKFNTLADAASRVERHGGLDRLQEQLMHTFLY